MDEQINWPYISDKWLYTCSLQYNIKKLLEKYFGEEWVKHKFNGVKVDNKAIWILIDADTNFERASRIYYVCINFLNNHWRVIRKEYPAYDICCIYVDWT